MFVCISGLPSVGRAQAREGHRQERLRSADGAIRGQLALQERLPDARAHAERELQARRQQTDPREIPDYTNTTVAW